MNISIRALELLLFSVSAISFAIGHYVCYLQIKKDGVEKFDVIVKETEVLRKPRIMTYVVSDY